MTGQVAVLLMSRDASLADRVERALSSNGHRLETPPLHDLRDLARRATHHDGAIVLIDADDPGASALYELDRLGIGDQLPRTRFIALAEQVRQELLLEAMQAGVRHVICKNEMDAELEKAIDRLTPVLRTSERRGQVVTVLSAGGGCGATTVALNTARELSAEGQPSLLIDLDTAYGALGAYLGAESRFGVADVLGRDGPFDGQLIQSSAVWPNAELHLLASPATTHPYEPRPVEYKRLGGLLDACRTVYEATVIDAPRVPIDVASELVTASDHTFLVLQLTVKDLHSARRVITALERRAGRSDRIRALVSRHGRRHQMIGTDEAVRVLGRIPLVYVRNDYRSAIRGLNYGKPLADVAPRSNLRRDLQSIVAQMRSTGTQRV